MVFNPIETGNKIRILRESRKMSQFNLADQVGITRAYIGKIERGENVARLDIYIQLAAFFDVSLNYLLASGDDEMDSVRNKIRITAGILENLAFQI